MDSVPLTGRGEVDKPRQPLIQPSICFFVSSINVTAEVNVDFGCHILQAD